MFKRINLVDMAESLFEAKIGKIIWPIYAAITIIITIVAVYFGKTIVSLRR